VESRFEKLAKTPKPAPPKVSLNGTKSWGNYTKSGNRTKTGGSQDGTKKSQGGSAKGKAQQDGTKKAKGAKQPKQEAEPQATKEEDVVVQDPAGGEVTDNFEDNNAEEDAQTDDNAAAAEDEDNAANEDAAAGDCHAEELRKHLESLSEMWVIKQCQKGHNILLVDCGVPITCHIRFPA
jgi:hypothetical protein